MKKIYLLVFICLCICVIFSCQSIKNKEDSKLNVEVILSQPIDPVAGIEKPETEKFEFTPKEWQKRKLLSSTDKNLFELYPDNDWNVSIENDKIMVSKLVNRYNKFKFNVDGKKYFTSGNFVSENLGEFGGKIDFIGDDGISYTVLKCSPISMFSIDGDIYLIEGSNNRSMGIGNLYKIDVGYYKDENNVYVPKWKADKLIKLNGYPSGFCINNTDIYITIVLPNQGEDYVSEIVKISLKDSLNSIDKYMEIKKLMTISNTSISGNSMVEKDDIVYIGLTYGLMTVNLNNKKIQLYTKK